MSFLDPCSRKGPIKSQLSVSVCLSVSLSVRLSVRCFSQKWLDSFFWFLAQWQIIGISKNWQSPFFQENSKRTQNGPKIVFFWIIWKILSLVFIGNNLKWKLILLLIFYHQFRIWQNSGSGIVGQNIVSQSNSRILSNVISQESSEWWSLYLACR